MAERRSHRLLWLLLLGLAVGALWFLRATRDPRPVQQGIAIPPGEEAATARIIAATVATIDAAHAPGRPFGRDGFAKAHGCVTASVTVPELPPRLQRGLFARPGEYQAWIRFSSGDARIGSDEQRASHGLALKVMGVPGPKLLAAEGDADTQDFVLVDSPRFFVPDVSEYLRFLEDTARGGRWSYFFEGGWWRPWRWHVRALYVAARMRKAPPASLLQTRYYSVTPYRLGPDQIVKYGARPCQEQRPPRRDRTDDRLREGLRDELRRGPACFELTVQLQVPGKNMPVEDSTVLWSERDSPPVPAARVTIPSQAFDSPAQDRFCEDLSFSPWHALSEHEPVGGLNRVRKAVYLEASRYRHARNGSPRAEPRGHCLDGSGIGCPAQPARPAPPPTDTARAPKPAPARAPVLPALRPAASPSTPAEAPPAPESPTETLPSPPPATEPAAPPATPAPPATEPTATPPPARERG